MHIIIKTHSYFASDSLSIWVQDKNILQDYAQEIMIMQ